MGELREGLVVGASCRPERADVPANPPWLGWGVLRLPCETGRLRCPALLFAQTRPWVALQVTSRQIPSSEGRNKPSEVSPASRVSQTPLQAAQPH